MLLYYIKYINLCLIFIVLFNYLCKKSLIYIMIIINQNVLIIIITSFIYYLLLVFYYLKFFNIKSFSDYFL